MELSVTGQLAEFIVKSGPAGVAIAALSFIAGYLALKNSYFLYATGKGFHTDMQSLSSGKNWPPPAGFDSKNALTDIVASIAALHGGHSHDMKAEVAYLFHRNFEKVSRDVTYLGLAASVAPLLGLLGTVIGILDVFSVMSRVAAPDSRLFAAGLYEALITTIMGLIVAVPCLFFNYGLNLSLKGFRIEAVEYSYQALGLSGKLPGCAAADGCPRREPAPDPEKMAAKTPGGKFAA